MQITNKTMNGKGIKKYYWYVYVELFYLLNKYFFKNEILLSNCVFEIFHVEKWEIKFFSLATLIGYALTCTDEERTRYGFKIE